MFADPYESLQIFESWHMSYKSLQILVDPSESLQILEQLAHLYMKNPTDSYNKSL